MKSNLEPEALSRKDQTGDGARSKEMVGGEIQIVQFRNRAREIEESRDGRLRNRIEREETFAQMASLLNNNNNNNNLII